MSPLPTIVAVIGPTASGKTALGVKISQHFNGEIVSGDAKQVYRGMDIGTAKEKNLPVRQHLLDIKNPGEKITVAEYQTLAFQGIDELLAEGKLPVIVGGSGLYVESVTEGYLFGGPGKKDRHPRYNVLKLGIQVPREKLRERVAARTTVWLERGLLDEIRGLLARGVSPAWLEACGLEYKYITQHILGQLSLDEAIRLTNISQGQFIKRQDTWWRRHSDVIWVQDEAEALERVSAFQRGVIKSI